MSAHIRSHPPPTLSARFHSIAHDASRVRGVHTRLGLPLIANERCGEWYVPPDLRTMNVRAHFKSTDGHRGRWEFSMRRLNLDVLRVVGEAGGCIVVDSSKWRVAPDALSKTIPIWCAVMNRLLFPDRLDSHGHHILSIPGWSDPEEVEMIYHRLNGFVDQAKKLNLNIADLRTGLKKPMKPQICADVSGITDSANKKENYLFNTVYLCMASECPSSSVHTNGPECQAFRMADLPAGYVQGAADDAEFWSPGLTSAMYWEHLEALLAVDDEEKLLELIRDIVNSKGIQARVRWSKRIAKVPKICIAANLDPELDFKENSLLILCTPTLPETQSSKSLHLKCPPGKFGSRNLRAELEKLPEFMIRQKAYESIYIACCDGKDLSIGVALALICLYCDDEGNIDTTRPNLVIDKTFVRRRLTWITTSLPCASPSRATLNSVNSFLMKQPG